MGHIQRDRLKRACFVVDYLYTLTETTEYDTRNSTVFFKTSFQLGITIF
jgi:hypothetical protein